MSMKTTWIAVCLLALLPAPASAQVADSTTVRILRDAATSISAGASAISSLADQIAQTPPPPPPVGPTPEQIAMGRAIWQDRGPDGCQQCHAAPEAWDIAHFGYGWAVILQRAHPAHVDSVGAEAVAAYVSTLAVPSTADQRTLIYQPGGSPLSSDADFGLALFGADEWPDTLSVAGLRAHDPRTIRIALHLPRWSDVTSPYDWLPGDTASGQLPANLHSHPARIAFYANPTIDNAVKAATRLLAAAHRNGGPCSYPPSGPADLSLYQPQACVNVAKWGAAAIYQAGIAADSIEEAGRRGTDHFWEVGHMSHKSQQFGVPVQFEDQQTGGWIYLGWMWNHAPNHNALYFSEPLSKLGHERLVTWMSLYTQVERNYRGGSNVEKGAVCLDVREAAQWGHVPWIENAVTFGYRYIESLLDSGWLPPDPGACSQWISLTQNWVGNRAGPAAKTAIEPLAQSLMARL